MFAVLERDQRERPHGRNPEHPVRHNAMMTLSGHAPGADGGEEVTNAAQGSFVDNYGYGQEEPDSFLPLWPDRLRPELGR